MPKKEQIQSIQLALCLQEKECPVCYAINIQTALKNLDCDCHGTGKVPLLEGVREKCPIAFTHTLIESSQKTTSIRNATCAEVGCQGWVPTQDPWKWFGMLGECRELSYKEKNHILWEATDGPLAFYQALLAALGEK